MPDRPRRPAPDVFDTFSHRVERGPQASGIPASRHIWGSLGAAVAVLVVAGVLGVLGFRWGADHEPELTYLHPVWEGVIKVGWALGWAVLAAAFGAAVTVACFGVPWLRRRRSGP